MPVSITAPYWHLLLKASVLPAGPAPDGFLRIRDPRTALGLAGSFDPKELAVFVCDFSRLSLRSDLAATYGCAGFFSARRRHLCVRAMDFRAVPTAAPRAGGGSLLDVGGSLTNIKARKDTTRTSAAHRSLQGPVRQASPAKGLH